MRLPPLLFRQAQDALTLTLSRREREFVTHPLVGGGEVPAEALVDHAVLDGLGEQGADHVAGLAAFLLFEAALDVLVEGGEVTADVTCLLDGLDEVVGVGQGLSACLRFLASRATAQSSQIFSVARRILITARGRASLRFRDLTMRLISLKEYSLIYLPPLWPGWQKFYFFRSLPSVSEGLGWADLVALGVLDMCVN